MRAAAARSLRQLYEFVLPVLAQTEAELGALEHARGGARRRAGRRPRRWPAGGGDDSGAASEEEEEEEEDVLHLYGRQPGARCAVRPRFLRLVLPSLAPQAAARLPLAPRLPSARARAWVRGADAPRGGTAQLRRRRRQRALGWVDAFFDKLPRLFEGA